MARTFNPRYALEKLKTALAAAQQLGVLGSGVSSSSAAAGQGQGLAAALARGLAAYEKQLTTSILITGAAMLPTLNPGAAKAPDAVEKLLVRLIPAPSAKSVFHGDVVALTSPFAASAASETAGAAAASAAAGAAGEAAFRQDLLVRRVAALPGDELVTGEDDDDESYVIPEGHCWVLADNEALGGPPAVIDSRAFGPLPLANIVGRILYAARSESDHGPVENSPEGMAADAPVVEEELDLARLCGPEPARHGCST